MSVDGVRSHEKTAITWNSENAVYRRAVLQAICLGAAVEIVNLLDADGADYTYSAKDFAAIIYKNIHGTAQ